mgnify:CR=1 FL=1
MFYYFYDRIHVCGNFDVFLYGPAVQNGIFALGGLVTGSGYAGTLIFGLIKRALIPFGLHHVFYMLLADCSWRHYGSGRSDGTGWTEYLFCTAG